MTTDKLVAPKRRFELTIEIGADTLDDVFMLMDHFQRLMSKGSLTCCSGGASSGGSYQLDERPEQTHDKWQVELEAYLEQSRKERSSESSKGGK